MEWFYLELSKLHSEQLRIEASAERLARRVVRAGRGFRSVPARSVTCTDRPIEENA